MDLLKIRKKGMTDSSIIWVASFDIGKKNFSFYIEEFDKYELMKLKDMPKKERYNQNGTTTQKFEKLLQKLYRIGTTILLKNTDLTNDCDPTKQLDTKVLYNMTSLLDKYREYWYQCDLFLIEKQMSFGKRHNTMAIKVGQHCWSYFSIKYNLKKIVEFPAYHKTQILGAPRKEGRTKNGNIHFTSMSKRDRKKWCITKALAILIERNDSGPLSEVQNAKKKDDLSDVICQLQAYKYLEYVSKK